VNSDDAGKRAASRGASVWSAASEEYRRFVALLHELGPDDWSKRSDCARWDVRKVALHVLGATEANASPRELIHQFRRGLALNKHIESHHWVDGINELQVRERDHLGPRQLIDRIEIAWPKAVRGRRLAPPPLRWLPVPFGPPIGWQPLTYLLKTGFTRDVWMHRVDIARATDKDLTLTPAHDGTLVAGIVIEWANTHGEAFVAQLQGPAGGRFVRGSAGEEISIDAIEFCRILAGRAAGGGILQHKLPL
jgi:uncharacterized protein (TIGR03083 family)